MSANNPPTRDPVATAQGTVSRPWLRYFLALGQGNTPAGTVPTPTPATALDFVRINAAGDAYETQTPAQVLADIDALSETEAGQLFEPLVDKYSTQDGSYQVQQSDSGGAILFTGAGAVCVLPGQMPQGVKVTLSAGNNNGLAISADGAAFLNGQQGAAISLAFGGTAYCEVLQNRTGSNAEWSLVSSSQPGILVSDGATSVEDVTGIFLENMLVIESELGPSLIQSTSATNATLQLNSAPALGNYVLILACTTGGGLSFTPPDGMVLLSTGGTVFGNMVAFGGVATSGFNPTYLLGATSAFGEIYEFSNVALAVGTNGAMTSLGSGAYNYPSSPIFAGQVATVVSLMTNTSGSMTVTDPTPSGNAIDVNELLAGSTPVVSTILNGATATVNIGYTLSRAPGSIIQVTLYANSTNFSGNVTIVPNIPVTGGGTSGNFQSVSILSGATLSGDVLEISGGITAEVGTVTSGFSAFAAGAGIDFTGTSPDLTINNSGVLEILSGTTALSGTIALGTGLSNVGNTINAAGGITAVSATNGITGSISGGTLELSGTLLELIEGTTSLTGMLGIVAGSNISITGTSGGLGTISASGGGTGGSAGVISGGTLYPTLAAGSGFTLTGSGGVLTGSAGGGGGGGGYPPGTLPTIVQVASTSSGGNSATFSAAPTAGNLLVAMNFNPSSPAAGTGWTLQTQNASGSDWGSILTKIAGAGESATQSPMTGVSTTGAMIIWEIHGQASTGYFLFGQSQVEQSGLTNVPVFTPNSINCIGLSAVGVLPSPTISAIGNIGTQDALLNTGSRFLVAGHTDPSQTPMAGIISAFSATASSKCTTCLIIS